MPPDSAGLARLPETGDGSPSPIALLRRSDVQYGHRKKLLAAISVKINHRLIDGEELRGRLIEDTHRHRVIVEQQSERRIAPLQLGDVDLNSDTAAVRRPALLDAHPAAVRKSLLFCVRGLRVARKARCEPCVFTAFCLRKNPACEALPDQVLKPQSRPQEIAPPRRNERV